MIKEIIIIILVLLLILLITFVIYQRAKKQKIKEDEEKKRQETLNKILGPEKQIKNPRDSLNLLNKMARNFFKQYLNEKQELTYIEVEELLKKKKDKESIEFCEEMNSLLYSGKEIKKDDALRMINKFNDIVRNKKMKLP